MNKQESTITIFIVLNIQDFCQVIALTNTFYKRFICIKAV